MNFNNLRSEKINKKLAIICVVFSLLLFLIATVSPLHIFLGEIVLNIGEKLIKRSLTHEIWQMRFVTYELNAGFLFLISAFFYCIINENKLTDRKKTFLLTAVLIFFIVFTFISAVKHEAWNDEVFAWQLSEYHSIPSLFHEMRYEGHFLPWYLILMPFSKMSFPIETLNIIAWFINALTAVFFLFKSPFSLLSKTAVLCTSVFLYWNPVVARPYVLIPPLLFLLASIYNERNQKPVIFGILLALLANTHAYIEGFVGITALLFFIYDVIIPWKDYSNKEKKAHVISLAVTGLGIITAALQVLPALFIIDKSEAARLQFNPSELKYFFTAAVNFKFLFPCLLLCVIYFTVKLYKTDKKLFTVFIVSIVYMFLFSVFIYGLGIPNRAFLWFWIMLFVLWIIKDIKLNKSVLLFVTCLFLISPSHNINDIKSDFCNIPAGQKYIQEKYTNDVPVFIQTAIFTSTFVYGLHNEYNIHYVEDLIPFRPFSASQGFNTHSTSSLSDMLIKIKNSPEFSSSQNFIIIICDWYDTQLKKDLEKSGIKCVKFSPCSIWEFENK